ncbi:MAG: PDZ domain-containing protein [Pirellulaceae bacterium]|nr:PDZ domain-containing protein [Pirellulaceae bacterium]
MNRSHKLFRLAFLPALHARRSWYGWIGALVALGLGILGSALGQDVKYTLRFPAAAQHYVDVQLEFATEAEQVELMMPVWTPGSYLVREYPRFVQDLRAVGDDEQPLTWAKTKKNRWMIDTSETDTVKVSYRVYGRELSVRTNWIDADLAVLNGAATFMVPLDRLTQSMGVEVVLPAKWARSVCPLPSDENRPHVYLADNFDQLVDSPILCGDCEVYPFQVDGINHYLVNLGDSELWDGQRAASDLKKVVTAQKAFWGELPYPQYYFLNVVLGAGGGLEHDNSTLIMSGRRSMNSPQSYRRWLSLCSHELFHAWSVRRLRPKALMQYDYENEVYTRELWIAEGITSYYQDLLLARAGLMTSSDLLQSLSAEIRATESRPGNLVQSLTDSSFDSWIDFYRPHENSANTSVSYYSRGAVAGLMLDCELRQRSAGAVSLDDVMREVYRRFRDSGYENRDFREVCDELTNDDFSQWFQDHIEQPKAFDYAESLSVLGLNLSEAVSGRAETAGESPSRAESVTIGVMLRDTDGQARISAIRAGSTGAASGLNLDDEVIAVGDRRVTVASFAEELRGLKPGESIKLVVSRRGQLREFDVQVEATAVEKWRLTRVRRPNRQQRNQWSQWLEAGAATNEQPAKAQEGTEASADEDSE